MSTNRITAGTIPFMTGIGNFSYLRTIIKGLSKEQADIVREIMRGISIKMGLPFDKRLELKDKLSTALKVPGDTVASKGVLRLPNDVLGHVFSFLDQGEMRKAALAHSAFAGLLLPEMFQQFLDKTAFTYKELKNYQAAFHLPSQTALFAAHPDALTKKNVSLKMVQVNIGDAELIEIIKCLPFLTKIDICACTQLTNNSIRFLAEARPNITSIAMSNFEELDFDEEEGYDEEGRLPVSFFFNRFPCLQELELGHYGSSLFDEHTVLELPQNLPPLTVLKILASPQTSLSSVFETYFTRFHLLEEVNFYSYPEWVNTDWQRHWPNLKKVTVRDMEFEEFEKLLKKAPHLMIMNDKLEISESSSEKRILEVIKHFPVLKGLMFVKAPTSQFVKKVKELYPSVIPMVGFPYGFGGYGYTIIK